MKKRQTSHKRGNKAKSEEKNDTSKISTKANDVLPCEESTTSKHEMTPLKSMNKTSKHNEGNDVHTVPQSPVSSNLRLSKLKKSPISNSTYSPYLGISSQELPEVIWDYTSPKTNTKCQKPKSTTTINDLIKNIQSETQDSNVPPSSANQLLEKWMNCKKKSPGVSKEAERYHLRHLKKRSLKREMKAIFESITEPANANPHCGNSNGNIVISDACTSNHNLLGKLESCHSFGEDSNSYQSDEDLWGENSLTDDVLLVNASQEVENCLNSSLAKDVLPQAASGKLTQVQNATNKLDSLNAASFPNDVAQFSKKQKHEDPTKSFEVKVQLPDEDIKNFENMEFGDCWEWTDESFIELDSKADMPKTDFAVENQDMKLKSKGCVTIQNNEQTKNTSSSLSSLSNELAFDPIFFQNDVDDDIFDDEPAILTWIEKVESNVPDQQKCTAEEIARKKEDAQKRLKEKKKQK